MNNNNRKILRPYVSTAILFILIIMLFSGTALYFAPSCRVARETGWSFLFISKDSWESIHLAFVFLFTILGILHLYINWKAMVSHMKSKEGTRFNRPLVITIIATLLMLMLAVFKIPPVSRLTDYQESMKRTGSFEQYKNSSRRTNYRERGRRYRSRRHQKEKSLQ